LPDDGAAVLVERGQIDAEAGGLDLAAVDRLRGDDPS
jgi:hypothetical protein